MKKWQPPTFAILDVGCEITCYVYRRR